ncbi:MAG: alcohol dehydrogenase [Blastopirellula sp.]|nr:MAG: alcohol dehydrogenase [Blastopirellula sp.]
MPDAWNFYSAGQLMFGRKSIAQLGRCAVENGWQKIVIVTDPILASLGLVDRVKAPLEAAGVTVHVFDGSCAEPSLEVVANCEAFAQPHQPDAVLGLGGGSNIDLAKMLAILLTHGGQPSDYFSWNQVPGPVLPIIAVPTTSGTGSEVSQSSVLTDIENQMKVSTLSQYLRPRLAVVDPELTVSCPPQVTADSGIDALTHAVEAYLATDYNQLEVNGNESQPYSGSNPLTDTLAEKAIRLVGGHLRTAVASGEDINAREQMALAATLAGLAFSNCGVAVVHALEYPIGGAVHCSHGAGNGLLLPYVMQFNLPVRKEKLANIAGWLGVSTENLTPVEAAQAAVDAVHQLKKDIGIPEKLRAFGTTAEMLPGFAAKSITISRLMLTNPRKPSEADLLQILQEAL